MLLQANLDLASPIRSHHLRIISCSDLHRMFPSTLAIQTFSLTLADSSICIPCAAAKTQKQTSSKKVLQTRKLWQYNFLATLECWQAYRRFGGYVDISQMQVGNSRFDAPMQDLFENDQWKVKDFHIVFLFVQETFASCPARSWCWHR